MPLNYVLERLLGSYHSTTSQQHTLYIPAVVITKNNDRPNYLDDQCAAAFLFGDNVNWTPHHA